MWLSLELYWRRIQVPPFELAESLLSCLGRGFRYSKLEMLQSRVIGKVVVALCKRTWSLLEKSGGGQVWVGERGVAFPS
jgi:hypothetical protein